MLSAWWPRCRLIESSLGSVATKLNFFIHNLAQMKFTGSDARPTLSFAPRTHTIKTSGRIRDVFLCRHERVFNPSKGYVSRGQAKGQLGLFCPGAFLQPHVGLRHPGVPIPRHSLISPQTYVVKVQRESPSEVTFVQRSFEEFQELHNKLRLLFPSSMLPRYPPTDPCGPPGLPATPLGLAECPSPQLPQQVCHRAVAGRSGGRAAEGGAERLHLAPHPRCPRGGRGAELGGSQCGGAGCCLPGGGDGGNAGEVGVNALCKTSVSALVGDVVTTVTANVTSSPHSVTSSTPSSTRCHATRRQLAPTPSRRRQVRRAGGSASTRQDDGGRVLSHPCPSSPPQTARGLGPWGRSAGR